MRSVGLLVAPASRPTPRSREAGDDALVGEGQLHDATVEGPRTDPDARPEPGVEGVSSNLHRLLTVLVARRRSRLPRRRRRLGAVTVLFATHPAYLEHLTGPGHPERPSRLQAVIAGRPPTGVAEALDRRSSRCAATRADLERVHPAWYLDRIDEISRGRRRLDRRRHPPERPLGRGRRRSPPAPGSPPWRRCAPGPGDGGVLRRAPARPPRHADRRRWASASSPTSPSWPPRSPTQGERVWVLRLRRPPRQRHAGGVLRRPAGAVRQPPPVAAVPGHRSGRPRPAPAPARARR